MTPKKNNDLCLSHIKIYDRANKILSVGPGANYAIIMMHIHRWL